MTQRIKALQGIITPEMEQAAAADGGGAETIRRLIGAAQQVSTGNLDVEVPENRGPAPAA